MAFITAGCNDDYVVSMNEDVGTSLTLECDRGELGYRYSIPAALHYCISTHTVKVALA